MKKLITLFFAAILCAMTANAETYRYSGEKDGWAGTVMTASTDGFYSYYGPVKGGHQFKIGTSSNQWAYNHSYVSKGFNNTDIQDIGDWGSDNCYTWTSATHYILVYYPNTTINSDSKVKICASTVLPNDAVSEPEPEPTELTYNVTVPEGTNTCYIVGDMNSWTFTEMTKTDDTHYTITIEGAKKTHKYKYTSGADWGYVEKDANGNELGDRTYVDGNDVVAKWAAVFDPDAVEQELTYSVTVPEGTYACYIAMDTDPAQEGWEFNEMTKVDDTHYTFVRTGLKSKTYKYACGEGWEYVEKTAEDGEVADRTWAENDVVAKWATVYNPTAPTYDYYIAGSENLTGYNWKENGLGMIQDGELYKAIFSALPAGIYEFKITDGTWAKQWNYSNLGAAYEEVSEGKDGEGNPNGNIKFVTEEAKNITVTFNPTTGKITFEGLTEKLPAVITYVLMGVNNDWTTGISLVRNEENTEYEEYMLLGQEILAGDAVKVVTLTDGVATAWCGNVDVQSIELLGITFAEENGNIILAPGKYDFYYKVADDGIYIAGEVYPVEPTTITWELNGGELVVEVPTQEELWASFKTAAGLTTLGTLVEITEAGAGKPHNDIDNQCACRIICAKLLDANVNAVFALPEWAWLKAYIMTVQSGLPETSSAAWRYAIAAFFLQSQHSAYPASADFTEAGKPENWGAAYEAAHEVVLPTEPVAEDYVLPTPVKEGYTFVGWYDNAEGTGEAYTVIPAGWAGTLYAIWKQGPTTALENIAVDGKAVKAIVNGQLIIIKNGVQYNAQGQVVK